MLFGAATLRQQMWYGRLPFNIFFTSGKPLHTYQLAVINAVALHIAACKYDFCFIFFFYNYFFRAYPNRICFGQQPLQGENLNILLIPFAAFTPKVEKNDEKGG